MFKASTKSFSIVKIKLSGRLRPLYFGVFLQNFIFWYAIEKLFMKNIGFSDLNIARVTIIFTTVTLLVNIPLGLLADRWSRKGILVIASVFLAIGSLICGLSDKPLVYTVGLVLWGVFLGCYSGTYESIIYDTVIEESDSPDLYEYYYGQMALYSTAGLIISALAGGIISDTVNLQTAYLLSIPLALGAIIPIYRFSEPTIHKQASTQQMISKLGEIIHLIKRQELMWIAFGLTFLSVALRLTLEFGPLWLVALFLPVILYGPAIALLQTSVGLSGLLAHRINQRASIIRLIAGLTLLVSLALVSKILSMTIAALGLLALGYMILTIILSRRLHEAIPSRIRAGTISFVTTMGYIAFLPVAGLFGIISERNNIFSAGWLIIGITVLLAATVIKILRNSSAVRVIN